ncbi:hypothetical protein LMG18090_04711 [Ralstonia mannitolilytica]|nr:hypothetical protein LMG18090_04711 [Ralstonia mannitolilytica]
MAPNVQLPNPPLRLNAAPIWSISVLETSATFTSSMTCCGASTVIMLMMRALRSGVPFCAVMFCMPVFWPCAPA